MQTQFPELPRSLAQPEWSCTSPCKMALSEPRRSATDCASSQSSQDPPQKMHFFLSIDDNEREKKIKKPMKRYMGKNILTMLKELRGEDRMSLNMQ